MANEEIPQQNQEIMRAPAAQVVDLLDGGELEVVGMMPWSSNYTLLSRVRDGDTECLAIYKPRKGERPLWDFARGTLCRREHAAYLVDAALGWGLIPPTVLRDGPYGLGSVQLFIEADFDTHLLMMEKESCYRQAILRLVAFDVIINNADRKSGHCLKGSDGRMWAIDHGIAFHSEYKLRTVLWDYISMPLPADDLENLRELQHDLRSGGPLRQELGSLLASDEIKAFGRRVDCMVASGAYPQPGPGPNVPWPPV